jgi:hypothetical protein
MSAAQKYGRPVESLSHETLQQARAAGQVLADKGVVQEASLGSGAPTHTPAMKYGGTSETIQRQLSLSRSL